MDMFSFVLLEKKHGSRAKYRLIPKIIDRNQTCGGRLIELCSIYLTKLIDLELFLKYYYILNLIKNGQTVSCLEMSIQNYKRKIF